MTNKKKYLLYIVLSIALFGAFMTSKTSFSAIAHYTDNHSDATNSYTEILSVSVDNAATLMIFKLNLNESWNFTPFNCINAFISVDNATGITWGYFTNFLFDYVVTFSPIGEELHVNFKDVANGSNDLDFGENKSMGYSLLYYDNKTADFGWKISQYYQSRGFLNLSYGQTIYVKFRAGSDSDFAPNVGLEPIKFTLEEPELTNPNPVPSFELLIVSVSLISIICLVITKKRSKLF